MLVNWRNSAWPRWAFLGAMAGIAVNLVCVRLVLRKIERKIDQPFDLGVLSERRRAELEAEEQEPAELSPVIPFNRPRRTS